MPPRKATDRCGNTTHDYPRHRDDGEKVLIGLVNGTAEYYDRTQNRVKGLLSTTANSAKKCRINWELTRR